MGFTPLGLGFTPLALLWVYPFDWAKPGVSPADRTGFTLQMGSPPTFQGKGVNPAIDLIMNLTFFWRAWKLDFWPLLGVYPPGLALADYWSHLLGVYLPWPGVYPPGFTPLTGLSLGFPPLTARGLPLKWGPPHVLMQRGKPSNRFNNEFDLFLAGVEIGFLASTWGLPPWSRLGRLLQSSTWGLPPLAWGLPP